MPAQGAALDGGECGVEDVSDTPRSSIPARIDGMSNILPGPQNRVADPLKLPTISLTTIRISARARLVRMPAKMRGLAAGNAARSSQSRRDI